ncbi:Na+/H+ antiporter family protein [Auritidibacter ignavus]|uniref:Na+/H+ antiporter family protein n=1 Tax=Auritidibacter ignavus TaxID=678932 RepID=UPI00244CB5BD|nr:Na+/H+ antiporter NhaC family protein [Auritidibacter ignavus]WGH83764.1 Na+/H+ antiporter NhaC family protein [Auritidibacter ignavus]WHS28565.1 Na+/H+ antiporter NhaC family protein [Auritidibacter ignavus]
MHNRSVIWHNLMLVNAVIIAVVVMLVLAVCRLHVVIALFIGALVGGLVAGMGLESTMVAFQDGLGGGARVALSYALLGAFAMAVANSGLPKLLSDAIVKRLDRSSENNSQRIEVATRYTLIAGVLLMSVFSQNLIPVHIAFIPLLIPPLLGVLNRLHLDRRAIACVLTFGLVTTYMYVPLGFGQIFLHDILLSNIELAGLDTSNINIMSVMAIPATGMLVGMLVAVFITYRKPRTYRQLNITDTATEPTDNTPTEPQPSTYKIICSLAAILACFGVQVILNILDSEANGLLVGALLGLAIILASGAVKWNEADNVFNQGMRMMAMIGFTMITAQGFAAVMAESGAIEPLVAGTQELVGDQKALAALAMLVVGLVVTMGIGSSFSTLPIISSIYVPLCLALGFSPAATVAIVGTSGALGDAGSPASDSTLGPTAGLGADGQHDHIKDSVIPTFLHFNIPLLVAGWIAAMVL